MQIFAMARCDLSGSLSHPRLSSGQIPADKLRGYLCMPRLFISHSGHDNALALAFQSWLTTQGWPRDEVFLDLHSIGAGEKWRETLRKANAVCEAVVLLASPEALESVECQKELELAEALGKEIICGIARGLSRNDPRLSRYRDRQFVDLTAEPRDTHIEPFEYADSNGTVRVHRLAFNSDALASIKGRLDDLGIAPGSFPWPPRGIASPEPYPGLSAFSEDDAGIFFGREAEIMAALTDVRQVARRRSPRLIMIDAASGAGKSSFLRAGLWPRLKRNPEFAPLAILRPAQGIISGPEGIGRRLAPWFERHAKPRTAGAIYTPLLNGTMDAASTSLAGLFSDAVELATDARRAARSDAKSPILLIAIDQAAACRAISGYRRGRALSAAGNRRRCSRVLVHGFRRMS